MYTVYNGLQEQISTNCVLEHELQMTNANDEYDDM